MTTRRRATARRRIPTILADIRNSSREAENDFRTCQNLEEQLFHELRNLHRGRGPWKTELPATIGAVSLQQRDEALTELENFEKLDRQQAYKLAAVILAYKIPVAT
ncbi:MAG TPA: hypothetical protein VF996_02430 [Candidatus Saccharimonadales bacterium]